MLSHDFTIKASNGQTINFKQASIDTQSLQREYIASKCLANELQNTTSILNKFAYSYAIVMKTQLGKSIYNTDLTDGITQHMIDNKVKTDTSQYKVPLKYGYLSHMREDVDRFFLGNNLTANDFFIDLEYLLFIYKFFGKKYQ
jgi:hypothetical protein